MSATPKTETASDWPDDAKPEPKRGDVPREIPVRVLVFDTTKPVDLPGKSAASSVTGSPEPKPQAYYRIFYMPAIRHHRIEFYAPGKKTPEVMFVHETWVTWRPV